jgi:hypothetical protein
MSEEQRVAVAIWDEIREEGKRLTLARRNAYDECKRLGLTFVLDAKRGYDRWPRERYGDWRWLP